MTPPIGTVEAPESAAQPHSIWPSKARPSQTSSIPSGGPAEHGRFAHFNSHGQFSASSTAATRWETLLLSAFRPQSRHLASDRQLSDVVGIVISDDQATPKEGVLAGTVGHRREEIAGRITDELDDGFQIFVELRERLPPLS